VNDTTGKNASRAGRRLTATLAAAIQMAAPSAVLAQGQSSVNLTGLPSRIVLEDFHHQGRVVREDDIRL
jgi:hypothetical protein